MESQTLLLEKVKELQMILFKTRKIEITSFFLSAILVWLPVGSDIPLTDISVKFMTDSWMRILNPEEVVIV